MQGAMISQSTNNNNSLSNNKNSSSSNSNNNSLSNSNKNNNNSCNNNKATSSKHNKVHTTSPKQHHQPSKFRKSSISKQPPSPQHFSTPPLNITPSSPSSHCCLSTQQLDRFYNSNHQNINNSFLFQLTHPYFKSLCQHLPTTLPPNIFSIIGLGLNIISTLLLSKYCHNTSTQDPRWVNLTAALCLLIFQVLNAIDKTRLHHVDTFTPFREFSLHCIDVLSNAFTVVAVSTTTHLNTHPKAYFTINTITLSIFYLNHWRTYCTGVCHTQIFDVSEVRALVVLMHLVTFVSGSQVWETTLLTPNWPMKLLPVTCCLLIGLYYIGRHLFSIVMEGGVGRNGSTLAGTSVISPLIPIGCLLSVGLTVLKNSGLILLNPLIFTTSYVITILKLTIQLIISHMSQSAMRLCDPILLGPIAQIIGQYFNWLDDKTLMFISFIHCLLIFSYFSLKLSRDILNHKLKQQ